MAKILRRIVAVSVLVPALLPAAAWAAHALALGATPKYPPGFTHFDYVNPDAPKGGTLYLANPDRRNSFDKFNPFTLKGTSPAAVAMMFESLGTSSWDEPATVYGLLAEDMSVAADGRSATFRINPKARFNDGSPVTAEDVKYSFDTLMSKAAAPQFPIIYAEIARAVAVDRLTVRFDFKTDNWQLPQLAAGMAVFSPKWAAGKPFDKLTFEKPIASGPYLIEQYDTGRNITLRRNPEYWGADLPVNRGLYNFDRIVYRMYKDDVARLEAFKAGEFDFNVEYSARNWARSYTGSNFRNGNIIRRTLPVGSTAGMQGFIMNLRRAQFQDKRVREALGLSFDFEWMDRQVFYGQYKRIYSFWNNSPMAASGVPEGDELKLLKSLSAPLDPAVFGEAVRPPSTNPPSSLRANLRRAVALFAEAGWTYRDGALRNAKGEPYAFELIDEQGSLGRVAAPWGRNLAKLGVQFNYRVIDRALYEKRQENFDFDMISIRFGDSETPGPELVDEFGSKAADTPGSGNLWGIKDPAVDQLVARIATARSRDQLNTTARALDRVLMHGHYVIPEWYSSTHRVAYWNRFGFPDKLPLYYQAASWMVMTAWETKKRGQ
ncbi:MAG TPA: extracellular solute-binding protein [Burkholderiales bacterium]|nr:extracellular solute-binding protein [Burkholderiales bacterium]